MRKYERSNIHSLTFHIYNLEKRRNEIKQEEPTENTKQQK